MVWVTVMNFGGTMDYVEKLESITVVRFTLGLYEKPYESVKLRVAAFLTRTYSPDQTLWNVVVDGPQYWVTYAGIGPKIIETLANAINAEVGAKVVDVAIPVKKARDQGYYWTTERLQKANAMLDSGMSRSAVAKAHNKSSDGLKAAMRRYKMEKPRAKGQWYPIETAPKDGTVIIVYGQFPYKVNVQTVFYQTAAWESDEFRAGWTNASSSWLSDVTHWMPLPPPPKQ
jgi:hypothetical protein